MARVGLASVSGTAADAGARVADQGGNAVDATIAAALVSAVTHPGMCSLGSGGFITVWEPGGSPVAVDGGAEMPGRGLPARRFGRGGIPVHLEYAGGVDTVVGPGSVATPGALAACGLAAVRWGRLPWKELVEPAFEQARDGFPLPAPSHRYLVHAHRSVFGRDPRSHAALHDAGGRLRGPGERIRIEGLAESLRLLADEGVKVFYRGDLGRRIAGHVVEGGGILTPADLEAYEPRVRPAVEVELDGWRVATNPPPAIGGVALAAMLLLMEGRPRDRWTPAELRHLLRVQRAVMNFRRWRLDPSERPGEAARRMLEAAAGGLRRFAASAATLHTSAVDSDGLACSVTLSDGYGSGVMPPGTGLWLNNCLGEGELNRRGFHAWPPGSRLPSNMAPTVARHRDGSTLAIGSPGADRITTAILATLLNFVRLGMGLQEAVEHPRLHVEIVEEGYRVAYEAGLAAEELDVPLRRFEEPSMFFGGVEAALRLPEGEFELAADPRRTGGVAIGGRA